jgi:hypothetical protein
MAGRQKSKGERSSSRKPERSRPAPTPATEELSATLTTEESPATLPSEELSATAVSAPDSTVASVTEESAVTEESPPTTVSAADTMAASRTEELAITAVSEARATVVSVTEELAVTEESSAITESAADSTAASVSDATAAPSTEELPMNRDFEFKQLLRAYRAGIISEQTFETEMAALEHGQGANGSNGTAGGFRAFGKNYASEREAVLTFLDMAQAAEANGAVIFDNWAKLCTTDCIRSGIKMVAERERYHARVFENRLHELGGKCSAPVTEEGRKFLESISDRKIKDTEKLLIHNKLVPDPAARFTSIREFAELIKEDLETKEMVKLFVEDEISSGNWLNSACAALNAPAASKAATMSAMAE